MRSWRSIGSMTLLLSFFLISTSAAAGYEWSRGVEIPGLKAYQGLVAAEWNSGVLHVVTNDRNKNIKHARLAKGKWVAPVSLAHHRSGLVPDVANCGKTLHMVSRSKKFKIFHSQWDGRAWLNGEQIVAMEARGRVEISGMDGVLHLTHGGMNSERKRIFHAANSGWGWGHNTALPDQRARSIASMAGLKGTLHMVYVSKNSYTAWHTSRTRWGQWTPPVQIPGVETRRFVDLVEANGRLFMAFAAGTTPYQKAAPVAFCEWSGGQWSAPVTLEGYVCYGAPALAVQPGVPEQIHLVLPSKVGVLHLQTTNKTKVAPMRMRMKRKK